MKIKDCEIKKRLTLFARKIAADSLTAAASGNISEKAGSHIYIKTSGTCFENARPSDFIRLDMKNPVLEGLKKRPSCEYRMHIACYSKRPDIKAVIHAHPLFATTIMSSGIKLRPISLEFAIYIGNGLGCVDFAPPGTKALADAVSRVIADKNALFLKNHGIITVGESLQQAYLRALIIEREAKAMVICRLLDKKPPYMTNLQASRLINA